MVKFNYTKRKVQGLKLGQVVAKDLMKRITPGPSSKAALRDPYVELDVSGRQLTDEGFAEIAAALCNPEVHEGEHGNVVQVTELCLAGNALTAGSLLALARIVRDAATELRELDLSDNDIILMSVEDGVAWEEFLASFRTCSVLRRLNLSGNALGSWAFEILARVYAHEEPLDVLVMAEENLDVVQEGALQTEHEDVYDGVESLNKQVGSMKIVPATRDDQEHLLANVKEGSTGKNSRKDSSASKTEQPQQTHAVAAQSVFATTRGLRSIPYIIVNNTSMADGCALFLSYVLENHNLPTQLLPYVPTKAGLSAHEHEGLDSTSGCQGVVYLPNDTLQSAALKVLEVAELVRRGTDNESFQGNASPSKRSYETPTHLQKISDASFGPSSSQSHKRRRSTLSSGPISHASHGGATPSVKNELYRARSRLQVCLIKENGPHPVELWSASLQMLSLARQILHENSKEKLNKGGDTLESGAQYEPASKPTYASKLMIGDSVPGEPILAITGISNIPTTPVITQKTKDSNVSASQQVASLTGSLQVGKVPFAINTSPEPSPKPLGLPEVLWRRIIAFSSDAVGILSDQQEESIVQWAKNMDTLGREREALGKPQSEQIWRVLEAMGCLSYDVKT